MTKLHAHRNWFLKMFGNEHPPVHVHLHHPDGKAIISIDGEVKNRNVPADAIAEAVAWVAANTDTIRAQWALMDNPQDRGEAS